MKVSELIDKLQSADPDTQVLIPGYEGGYTDVSDAYESLALRDVNAEWYYGAHEVADEYMTRKHRGVSPTPAFIVC